MAIDPITMKLWGYKQGAKIYRQNVDGPMRKDVSYYIEKAGTLVGPLTKRMIDEQVIFNQ